MSGGGIEDTAIYERKAQKGSREEELNFSQSYKNRKQSQHMMDRFTLVMSKNLSAVITKEVQIGKAVAKFRSAQLAEHTRKNPPPIFTWACTQVKRVMVAGCSEIGQGRPLERRQ